MAVDVTEGLDTLRLGAGEENIDLNAVPVHAGGGAVANAVGAIARWSTILGKCVGGVGVVVTATVVIETPVEISSSYKRGGVSSLGEWLGNLVEL